MPKLRGRFPTALYRRVFTQLAPVFPHAIPASHVRTQGALNRSALPPQISITSASFFPRRSPIFFTY